MVPACSIDEDGSVCVCVGGGGGLGGREGVGGEEEGMESEIVIIIFCHP